MLQRKAQQPRNILRLEKKLKKDLMMIVERLKLIHKLSRMACPLTLAAWRRAGNVACPAQPQTNLANVLMKLGKTFLINGLPDDQSPIDNKC